MRDRVLKDVFIANQNLKLLGSQNVINSVCGKKSS